MISSKYSNDFINNIPNDVDENIFKKDNSEYLEILEKNK